MNISKLRYKGTQVAYAIICERKLWLFSKDIGLEHTSEQVNLGKVLDENTFREEEHLIDDYTSLDFVKVNDKVVVHEVKLSSSLEEAHKWQIKYYMYYLKSKGIEIDHGVLHYPKAKQTEKVFLSDKDIEMLDEVFKKIDILLSLPQPPKVINKPYCRKCAYFEFCYG